MIEISGLKAGEFMIINAACMSVKVSLQIIGSATKNNDDRKII